MIISVVLEALTGSFSTDLDRAAKTTEKRAKDMQRAFDELGSTLLKRLTAVAGPAALGLLVKQAIDAADQFSLLAQKTGITTEALSELDYAAKQSGVEDLSDDLIKFNKNIADAAAGTNGQVAAFKALGVSVKDAQGNIRGTEDILADVAQAVSSFPDGATKGAIAIQLFGKSGAELIPLLNKGAAGVDELRQAARELGLTISGRTANAANDFNDALDKLKFGAQGAGRSIVAELTPQLEELTKLINDPKTTQGIAEIGKQFADVFASTAREIQGIAGFLDYLKSRAEDAASGPQELIDVLDEIARVQDQLDKRKNGGFFDRLNQSAESVDDLNARLGDLIRKRNELESEQRKGLQGPAATVPLQTKPTPTFDPDADAKAQKAAAEARRLQEALAKGAEDIFQAQQDHEKAILESSLNRNLLTYSDYLDQRLALTEKEIDHEIEAAQGLLKNATADDAAILNGKIKALEIQRDIAKEAKDDDQAQRIHELALAYDEATAAAKDYLDQLQRDQQRTLKSFDQTPAQRRHSAIQNPTDDQFAQGVAQLDQQLAAGQLDPGDVTKGLESEYSKRLTLLKSYYDQQTQLNDQFFADSEAKLADFSTGFQSVFQEYIDSTKNVGASLANDLVGAIDQASSATADLLANTLLWGGSAEDAIKAIARTLITDLVSGLIKVALQMAINFALQKAFATASAATATAAAAELSLAWAPAAVGASIATLGAADEVGIAGYTTAIAAGSAISQFKEGGFTGNGGVNDVAGLVHGQEYVLNAEATRRIGRRQLDAMNDGAVLADQPGGGGGLDVSISNTGEPLDARVRRIGRQVFVELTPQMLDTVDADQAVKMTRGSGRHAEAISNKFRLQGRAVR